MFQRFFNKRGTAMSSDDFKVLGGRKTFTYASDGVDDRDPGELLTELVREYRDANPTASFARASDEVMRRNPELARRWADSNGTKGA